MASWEDARQYAFAGLVTAALVGAVYEYGMIRYGVADLSTLNKTLAMGTLFLLGIVLLLGPLSRIYDMFDGLFKYRKELGVLTFFTGATHVYLTMFPLARRGPFGFFIGQPYSAYPGLAALIILFILFVLSYGMFQRKSPKLWWKIQNWGVRLAFVAIAVHTIVLKYAGWVTWFADRGGTATVGNPALPPMALLGTVFVAFVALVRVSEFFGARTARAISSISFLLATAGTIWLFL
jgi:DMSO/TMAO reductase YedYZ heme-binding membrane subunit